MPVSASCVDTCCSETCASNSRRYSVVTSHTSTHTSTPGANMLKTRATYQPRVKRLGLSRFRLVSVKQASAAIASHRSSTERRRPLASTSSSATTFSAHRISAVAWPATALLLGPSAGGRSMARTRPHSSSPTATGPPTSSHVHRTMCVASTAAGLTRSRASRARVTKNGKPPCQNTHIQPALAGWAPNRPVGVKTPGNISSCSTTASAVKA